MTRWSRKQASEPRTIPARIKAIDAALRCNVETGAGREAQERLRGRRRVLVKAYIAKKGVEVHYESK